MFPRVLAAKPFIQSAGQVTVLPERCVLMWPLMLSSGAGSVGDEALRSLPPTSKGCSLQFNIRRSNGIIQTRAHRLQTRLDSPLKCSSNALTNVLSTELLRIVQGEGTVCLARHGGNTRVTCEGRACLKQASVAPCTCERPAAFAVLWRKRPF